MWIINGRAEGEALAAAGVELDLSATIDLFERVGLSAELAAFAEASLVGRLSVGLDVSDIAAAARLLLTGPALEVFLALLRESRISAGVWAKISPRRWSRPGSRSAEAWRTTPTPALLSKWALSPAWPPVWATTSTRASCWIARSASF